jgi:hypothetical protein
MGSRGRKSVASLSVIGPSGIEAVRRPEPPEELTDEQALEWRAVVNRLSADWFPRETHGMLAQYCRHVVAARRVAEMIRALEDMLANSDPVAEDGAPTILSAAKTLDRLLKMQEREGRALSSLATRMRISQQALYDKSKKKPGAAKKPWES